MKFFIFLQIRIHLVLVIVSSVCNIPVIRHSEYQIILLYLQKKQKLWTQYNNNYLIRLDKTCRFCHTTMKVPIPVSWLGGVIYGKWMIFPLSPRLNLSNNINHASRQKNFINCCVRTMSNVCFAVGLPMTFSKNI